MEFIKSWIFQISVSAIVVGMVLLIAPHKKTGKLVSVVASLYMVIAICTPLISGKGETLIRDFENILRRFDTNNYQSLINTEQTLLKRYESLISNEIEKILKEEDIEVVLVETVIKEENGEYIIETVTLDCAERSRALKLLKSKLNIDDVCVMFR